VTSAAEGAFLSHSNYLRALAAEAGLQTLVLEASALASLSKRFGSAAVSDTVPATIDFDQVRRSLGNAWGTELLLALSGRYLADDEAVRIANNWAVVQTYYVVYHASQALAVAKGSPRPSSHPKTQGQFGSFWIDRTLDLSPWSLGVNSSGYLNCPAGATIDDSLHAWTACGPTTSLSIAAKAYRTTLNDKLTERRNDERGKKRAAIRKAWDDDERERLARGRKSRAPKTFPLPRLTPAERLAVDKRVPSVGLIHYLYRLRIKTNYVDSEMFTEGPQHEADSQIVHRDVQYITSSTLLLHETRIKHLVGDKQLQRWADAWLKSNSPGGVPPVGLAVRRSFL
jgi:hypothetical protein